LESSALQEEIFFEEPKPRVLGKCFEKALATQEENSSLASSKVHEERERERFGGTRVPHMFLLLVIIVLTDSPAAAAAAAKCW
jgi:hypothetical protein